MGCDALQGEVAAGEGQPAFEDCREYARGAGVAAAALEREEVSGVRTETLAAREHFVLENIRQCQSDAVG